MLVTLMLMIILIINTSRINSNKSQCISKFIIEINLILLKVLVKVYMVILIVVADSCR